MTTDSMAERTEHTGAAQHAERTERGLAAHNEGRAILVTGATGFLGKALVHALVTRFDTGPVLVALRPKRGVDATARLGEILSDPCFAGLRAKALERLRVVPWDLETQEAPDEAHVCALADVATVYHCAASVSFDAPIEENTRANVTATLRVRALVDRIMALRPSEQGRVHLVHVSTAFAHGTPPTRATPAPTAHGPSPHAPARPEGPLPPSSLERDAHPNTYTFTKACAEAALLSSVNAGRATPLLPALAIVRPSIVFGARERPAPGWNPTFTATAGIVALVGRRALRYLPGDPAALVDHVPVDVVVDGLLLADYALRDARGPLFFHACAGRAASRTWGDFARLVLEANEGRARFSFLRTPLLARVAAASRFALPGLLLCALPRGRAFRGARDFGETLLWAARQHRSLGALFAPFTRREWTFEVGALARVAAQLPAEEKQVVRVGLSDLAWPRYVRTCCAVLAANLRAKEEKRRARNADFVGGTDAFSSPVRIPAAPPNV